ncbi:MAG: TfuA-like protein [Stappiaceae bacterium]
MNIAPLPIIIFSGPSIQHKDIPDEGLGMFRDPVAQGDVIKTVVEFGPCVIAIIDGYFQRQPAVRHKEILWAMAKGSRIFGAASIGALRAAELADQGMIGFGLIYRWYRRYALTPDDAVAVTHAPAELGHVPISDALIDLRRSFRSACKEGVMTHAQERRLTEIATEIPFPQRKLSLILERGATEGIALSVKDLSNHVISQKELDARGLLRHLSDLKRSGAFSRPLPTHPFVATDAFIADARAVGISQEKL